MIQSQNNINIINSLLFHHLYFSVSEHQAKFIAETSENFITLMINNYSKVEKINYVHLYVTFG